MPNNLTGDYDAVFQVSVRKINALLATLHQNKAIAGASPTFLHNASLRVGNASDAVRGAVQVQLSSPRISLTAGATSQITASLFIRARYIPDPGSQSMPAPVHGEVRVTYDVKPTVLPSGEKVLDIPFPAQDERIEFTSVPGTGLAAADDARIAAEVRKALRRNFRPMQVPLPGDFPFFEFKAVGSSPGQAIALPLQLSEAAPPAGAIESVSNLFLTGDFAIAVSKEHVETRLQPLTSSIRESVEAIRISVSTPLFNTVYRGQLSSGPTLTWKNGGIDVSGEIDLVTDSVLPNQWIRFKQAILLEWTQPGPYTYSIVLKPDGDPQVEESTLVPHDDAVTQIKLARDQALLAGSGPINQVLAGALDALNRGLDAFDPSSLAYYTGRQVTPDGLIIYGAIHTRQRTKPVVSFRQTEGCRSYTAFESWIPGGRITNYAWSTFELATVSDNSGGVIGVIPWYGSSKSFPSEPHRFTFSLPESLTPYASVCLRIDGTQLSPAGNPEDISALGGTGSCAPTRPEPLPVHPPGWEIINLPKWWPYPPAYEAILDKFIYAHIDLVMSPGAQRRVLANHIIHFANWDAEQPLEGLHQALSLMHVHEAPLIVDVVLPVGGLNMTRREVEARLGLVSGRERVDVPEGRYPVSFEVTEDHLSGWTRTFGVEGGAATFLMNSRGENVWNSVGMIDPRRLAAALDEFLVPGPLPLYCPVELAVRPGMLVPDIYVEDDHGQPVDLERHRGRNILVSFWQSWSDPCISELTRLQKLHDHRDPHEWFIVGLCADPDSNQIAEIRERYGLTFTLAHDVDRRIARLFDVCCWPTTVSINTDGIVNHVQFGMSPDLRNET